MALRRSDIFTSTHTNCTVQQGSSMTFLTCPNTFEIYNTEQIAAFPYEKKYAGEINGVIGTTLTLEKSRGERILWVFDQREIYSAEMSANGTIDKQLVMRMNVNSTIMN